MTTTTRTRTSLALRARTLLFAALLATTSFAVQASPVEIPRPAEMAPEQALALACADGPAFEGRLTSSTSSHPLIDGTTGWVYGYISNVVDDWSCTGWWRYDGLAWARNGDGSNGNFAWGTLIHSTSVACNWAIGSTDYLKANSTSDCPDSDAEYANHIKLTYNDDTTVLQGTYHQDATPDGLGDFMFTHSDCETYYAADVKYGPNFNATNSSNRPGSNCDPTGLDGTNTTQAIAVDNTDPTVAITAPSAGPLDLRNHSAYTPVFNPSDNVAGFDASHQWSLQRQIATAGNQACTGWTTDGSPLQGTTEGSQSAPSVSLTNGKCYRWVLTATDRNGNGPVSTTSGELLIDRTNPATDFSTPNEGSTVVLSALSYSVAWAETEANSGISSRSLERRDATWNGSACGTYGAWGNATSAASPVTSTGLVDGRCYQWRQTLTDGAGNSLATSSGTVRVSITSPTANFSTPDEGSCVFTNATSYSVAWSESAGYGSITGRSLQRQKGAVVTSGSCSGVTFADDGSPSTSVSPVNSTGLASGSVYQWAQTLTNSALKSAASTSGMVLVDTANPTGSIASPVANATLAGDITITGIADDALSFKEYELVYGAGDAPSSWTSLGIVTTRHPSTATLGTWSPGSLSGAYTLKLTVRDKAGNASSAQRLVYLENARRGDEAFTTRVPFDPGGGWGLDVGVANGEARLSRDLFSIPSYGPSQALSLSYSSLESGTAGAFGTGWVSNLTEYLSFESGFLVWHRADGGRVPFGNVAGTWTPPAGHYETLVAGTGGDAGRYLVTRKDQTTSVFEGSGAGRLVRIEDRFGKSLTLAWSASSATVTDASGRVTTLTIDATNNRITGVADSAGRTRTFGYTGTNLTSITEPDPDGAGALAAPVTTLAYDASHHLTTITRSRSRASGGPETLVWTIGYTSGKATSVVDPIAHASYGDVASTFTYGAGTTDAARLKDYSPVSRNTSTYAYDTLGRVTTLTDAEDFETAWTFDANSNPTAISRPDAGTTTYVYDPRGNVTKETIPIDGSTSVITKMTYNATNDLTSRWEATGAADTATTSDQLVTTFTYTGGHLTAMIVNCTSSGTTMPVFSAGCTGSGTQNAATNLLTTYTYTANGQLEPETDPLGRVTKHVYDTNGNETQTIRHFVAGQTATADRNVATTFAYDEGPTPDVGLVTTETDPLGNATEYAYDALGRQTSETLAGDATTDATIPELTRTTGYDELGNVLTETESWTPLAGGAAVNRTTTHVYDLASRETSATDPEGVTTSRTYDAAGNVLTETARGTTTERTYDGLGRIVSESGNGVETSFAYDGQGRVTTTTTDGVDRTLTYDLAGRLLTETDDAGGLDLTTEHAYDRLDRETAMTDANGIVTTTTYDRAGRVGSTIANDVEGTPGPGQDLTTSYAYDRAGNQTGMTDPAGTLTTTVYDALDRATTMIANDVASPSGPDQDVTTRTVYDAAGNVVATIDAIGVVARTILNVRNLPVTTLENCVDDPPAANPEDCTGTATATASVNVKRTTTYDGRGDVEASVLHRVGATGVETQETRDGAGRVLSSVLDAGAGRLNITTEYAYDDDGRQVAVRDPRGTITRTFYDAGTGQVAKTVVNCTNSGTTVPTTGWETCAGTGTADGTYNVTTTYGYDARGNRTSETAPNGRVTTSIYDDANRLITRIDNDVAGTPAANEDLVTNYYYDDAGRLVATKAPTADGITFTVTRSIYDELGRVTTEIRNCVGGTGPATCPGTSPIDAATNLTTTYTYDDAGQMVAMTEPDPSATSGGSAATVTTRYAYDAVGRLCRVLENASVDPASLADPCATAVSGTTTTNLSTRYTYDAAGNLASMIDAAGHATGYGYDAAGRMTSRTDALGKTVRWAYDETGNRIRQENRADPPYSNSVVWTYDATGRMLTRVADGATTTYTHDANGNQLTASAGGLVITATYDRLGRVLTVDDEDAGTTADTSYTYSLTSPTWTDPTGSYAATLDKFDRAVALTDPASASGWTFSYWADGQLASATQGNGNTLTQTFDAAGHLLDRETKTGGTSRAHYVYTYNRAGQILSEASTITGDPANGTVAYGYDPLGQLTGSTLSGTTTAYGWDTTTNRTSVQVGGGTAATTAYDAANRPTAGATPTASYASDADGRLTARPNQTMTWDHLGRLTAVKDAAGTTTLAAYTYDPLDRLRTVDYPGGNRIRFRYTGLTTSAAQWLDDVAGTVTRSIGNGWGGERLMDWTGTSSNRRFYGTNAHHDVTWLADSTGAVSQSLRYDPWGTPRSTVPQDYSPFRFQGSWYDATVDLAWVVTRWYAPSLGRFVSEDTLLGEPREPDSRHLYAYAAGEPVGAWDPDGQRTRPGQGPFYWYWRFVNYITDEMQAHARGDEFGHWWSLPTGPGTVVAGVHNLKILSQFGEKEHGVVKLRDLCRAGMQIIRVPLPIDCSKLKVGAGAWDHKPILKALVQSKRTFWTAVPDTGRKERIRFDIWSNIHYGYVGLSHGIPPTVLYQAQLMDGGNNSDADNLSVRLGFVLWVVHGRHLSAANVHNWIRIMMPAYRRIPGVVKPGWS